MPYIPQERRAKLAAAVDKLSYSVPYKSEWAYLIRYLVQVKPTGNNKDLDAVTDLLWEREDQGDDIGGDLNFAVSRFLCLVTGIDHEPRYSKFQDIEEVLADVEASVSGRARAVIRCVGKELYRRFAAPYEDQKCDENGEIWL